MINQVCERKNNVVRIPAITTVTEREQRVAEAIHNTEMEGMTLSSAGHADARDYIEGTIDADELVARARSRYGLD